MFYKMGVYSLGTPVFYFALQLKKCSYFSSDTRAISPLYFAKFLYSVWCT
jgi:hypothetical protein